MIGRRPEAWSRVHVYAREVGSLVHNLKADFFEPFTATQRRWYKVGNRLLRWVAAQFIAPFPWLDRGFKSNYVRHFQSSGDTHLLLARRALIGHDRLQKQAKG